MADGVNMMRGRRDTNFISITGTVMEISNFPGNRGEEGCDKMISVRSDDGSMVNFIARPDTYFVNQVKIVPRMRVQAFYDGNAPAVLIFPPQYTAVVIAPERPAQMVTVDVFNRNLVSSDGMLRLNLSRNTEIVTSNGQDFDNDLAGRTLVVLYRFATRSIPAQTTPDKIIVLCR